MSIEDTLRSSLAERLDTLDVPAGDVGVALRAGSRRRRRRAVGRGLAAACLLLAGGGIAFAVQHDDSGQPSPAPAPGTGWTRLPDSPLSPRANSLVVWTGDVALVIGGEVDHLCPPNADCASRSTIARDGAAYDPETKTWRTISAPADLAAWTPHAVVGDMLVVVARDDPPVSDRFFSYDVTADTWRRLPSPPTDGPTPLDVDTPLDIDTGLSALDGRVYTVGDDDSVLVLDPDAGAWSTLPASPHRPRLTPHYVTATPEGIVVVGVDATTQRDPDLLLAEVWDGEAWHRLGSSEILGGWGGWHWTGERLVSPYAECFDGGETNNYGRCIPSGGALDPGTTAWQPLEAAPSMSSRGWTLSAAEGPLVATWGYVYDDADGSWTRIERPADAPSDGTAATFADGTLLAFGGVEWKDDLTDNLSGAAWAWTP
jgi:hypothetical protein